MIIIVYDNMKRTFWLDYTCSQIECFPKGVILSNLLIKTKIRDIKFINWFLRFLEMFKYSMYDYRKYMRW